MVKEGSMDKIAEQIRKILYMVAERKILFSEAIEAILALIEQERKDNADGLTVAYMMGSEDMKAKYKPMVEALKEADRLAEEAQEDWIAVERMYLPERLIPFREIQEAID